MDCSQIRYPEAWHSKTAKRKVDLEMLTNGTRWTGIRRHSFFEPMNLVRLEPGQLWLLVWHEHAYTAQVPADLRYYLILLLRWDSKTNQWWVARLKTDGQMMIYPSASMWQEKVIDLDKLPSSYELERIA